MLYLILAIISSALVSVTMRVSQRFCRNNLTMLAANYVMCAVAAAFLAGGVLPAGEGSALALSLGGFCGLLYLLGFVLLQWNIRRSGVVLPATLCCKSLYFCKHWSCAFQGACYSCTAYTF